MQNLPPLRVVELTEARNSGLQPHRLQILQQPQIGRITKSTPQDHDDSKTTTARNKGVFPLEPALTVAYTLNNNDPSQFHRASPYIFSMVTVESLDPQQATEPDTLSGRLSSSLHKFRLPDGQEQCVFVFHALFIKYPGMYRLRCHVFEMRQGFSGLYAEKVAEIYGGVMQVSADKAAAPTRASTKLTRDLHDQGVKVKLKKESVRRRKSQTDVWTADRTSGNVVAGSNPVNHPTYRALPVQTGAVAPAPNNSVDITRRLSYTHQRMNTGRPAPAPVHSHGEDISHRMNTGFAAPAPAHSHGEDMRHRMTYHDMNNGAAAAWNAGTFQAAPVTNSAEAFPLYTRADTFQATPLSSGASPFSLYGPADLRALQAGTMQVPNMYNLVQAPNMYNLGGQMPNTYNGVGTYQVPPMNSGAVGGQVPNMCNGAGTFQTPATSTGSDRPNRQNKKTGSNVPKAPVAHDGANTAQVAPAENGASTTQVAPAENGVKVSQAPAMSTSVAVPVNFGTGMFADFNFVDAYGTYWSQ
ncbi:hypothetical protein, variant [Exophiala xenobiotica]|uniref:Velvet domain-containing protein n=1 Tax=Exophiala xenobiotica TaxID=348802 RepID=A0A0D2BCN4_9EURO|nr:hypothetical protein, variant [Exophiala xenobiotica]KIW49881.1 hypothetical protein, variant [Exophiala xenobiotica]